MSLPGIDALPAIGTLPAVGESNATVAPGGDGYFLNAITRGIDSVEADGQRATQALLSLATDPNTTTHDVILAMEQARLSLQLAAEVRQRVVDAYKEITGMQI